ncbi:hypothetical protein F5B21DRAFT_507792 [Xylaria acuta]|nr:hypothetical protein F5B21DRAFT_507792 [Xylaria acuta]
MDYDSVEPTDTPDNVSPAASTCSYMPPELLPTVIDPDGDLSLKDADADADDHHDHDHELPNTLLYGGFAESRPSDASPAEDWVVALPDDNPKAMAIILNIIHSRFELVPRTTNLISTEDLYQLTVLTDKYDLTGLLRLWASI